MKNKNVAKCALCGLVKEMSFEHVPPQSAFNNKPISIKNHIHLTETSNPQFGGASKSNRGFGRYSLCVSCNNGTGDWYARDFADFAHQGMAYMSSVQEPQLWIEGTYSIKPLNVIKQIFTMFMSASNGILNQDKKLVDALLDKQSKAIPDRYSIYLYSNYSPVKRMMGLCVNYIGTEKMQNWGEINFQPFGYLLADKSDPAHPDQLNITSFKNFEYGQEAQIKLKTRYLRVTNVWPGLYL